MIDFNAIWVATAQQLVLAGSATLIAFVIGVPLGVLASQKKLTRGVLISVTSILWTIPSLALLAFFIPILGIGTKPAIVVLSLYAFLPIARNTILGIQSVPKSTLMAAKALGFKPLQRFRIIELPIALPSIISGLQSAMVISIGIATLAAFIGAGGLGDFINRGLALNNSQFLLMGAIPAALLALIADLGLRQLAEICDRRKKQLTLRIKQWSILIISASLLMLPFVIHYLNKPKGTYSRANTIIVGSKTFTEQFILAEIVAQLLQAKTHYHIIKKLDLGTVAICHNAMLNGDIDMYPDYTGTALTNVLHEKYQTMSEQALWDKVNTAYQKQFNFIWLTDFGFVNNNSLAVHQAFAKQHHLKTIEDVVPLATGLTLGAPAGFIARPDSYPTLKRTYNIQFKSIKTMDPGLMYKAIEDHHVQVILAFSTSSRIQDLKLKLLKDNRLAFPSYKAGLIVRLAILKQHPDIKPILMQLNQVLDVKTMRSLNAKATIDKQTPASIAHKFLVSQHLLK